MKFYYVAAVVAVVVLIYFVSALIPLPWYVYLPFIAIFMVAYYWDDVTKYLSRWFPFLTQIKWKRFQRKGGRRKGGTGRRM